jgi:branched-chain amino acid transport system substrate-binding protein
MLINRLCGVFCAGFVALQVSSALAEPGVTDDKIILGQSAGLSGAAAPQIQDLTAGALAYFEVINSQGGVNGRKIVLESMDDAIDPKRTLENTNKLISDKHVFALFLYRGTPNVEAVLPVIERERIPLIGPSSGAQTMYVPFKKYLFPVRPSYHAEAEKIIDYLVTPGLKRIAIFHEDGTFGLDVLAGVQSAMKRRKLNLVSVAPYPRGTTNVDAAVTAISASDPQAVVVVGAANASVAFIKKMGALGKRPQFISLSNVNSAAFAKDLGEDGRGVGVTAITPYPYAAITPLAKEYKRVLKDKPNMTPSYLSLEGYMAAKVLVEGLRRAGPALTREKLVTALEGMRHIDLGGVDVNYGPSDRTGSTSVEIVVIGEGGKFLY